jgi:hypothetical protein
MTTEDEIQKLQADDLPAGARIWVAHFFSHFNSTYAQHDAFRRDLEAAGFGTPSAGFPRPIDSDEEIEGDGFWHHWAYTVVEASPAYLRLMDSRARQIAEQHGVRYDRWRVDSNPITGAPRVVDEAP